MRRGDQTRTAILQQAIKLMAAGGPDAVTLRSLGRGSGVVQSAVYHHFVDKDELLKATFIHLGRSLGERRAQLPPVATTREFLAQRVHFQFDNAESIVAVLKYFMGRRETFPELASTGFVPPQAYLHIVEVIERGNQAGDWHITDITGDAKVIVHAINGFVLEYYPSIPAPDDRTELVESITNFIWRALTSPSPSR